MLACESVRSLGLALSRKRLLPLLVHPRQMTVAYYSTPAQPAAAAASRRDFEAVVVGGGAAGIAVLGNLLENLRPDARVAWVDPLFDGGRINAKYREVPSNTKAGLFLSFKDAVEPLAQIGTSGPKPPPAVSALQKLPQDETCSLHYAGDLLRDLTEGLLQHPRVVPFVGTVTEAVPPNDTKSSQWSLTVQPAQEEEAAAAAAAAQIIQAPINVYCTGAYPTTVALPTPAESTPELLGLDTALKPSELAQVLPRDRTVTVGVVGASHSAILVLMNLLRLCGSTHPRLRVRWFTRSKLLKYAVYKEGWILRDNTGLKGRAAEFAREQLDGDNLEKGAAGRFVSRVDCSGGAEAERAAMRAELPGCDLVCQAVGFTNYPLPVRGRVAFDHETGGFTDGSDARRPVPGLFGAGIAFPERVVDPAGNVEHAVGFFKFMKFLKRVVPNWVKEASI